MATLMINNADSKRSLKQELAKLYIAICKEIFGIGVKRIKVDVHANYILIRALHGKSAILKTLDTNGYKILVRDAGYCLGKIFKERILEECNQEIGLQVSKVFRDYEQGEAITLLELNE